MSTQAPYRLGDILANAITHGVGAILALIGSVLLIVRAAHSGAAHDGAWLVTSCSIYATTLCLVYLCSTLYHSLVRTGARHVFLVLDHAAIYLLIAGSYTPMCLITLRGPVGYTILGVEYALAAVGIACTAYWKSAPDWGAQLVMLTAWASAIAPSWTCR